MKNNVLSVLTIVFLITGLLSFAPPRVVKAQTPTAAPGEYYWAPAVTVERLSSQNHEMKFGWAGCEGNDDLRGMVFQFFSSAPGGQGRPYTLTYAYLDTNLTGNINSNTGLNPGLVGVFESIEARDWAVAHTTLAGTYKPNAVMPANSNLDTAWLKNDEATGSQWSFGEVMSLCYAIVDPQSDSQYYLGDPEISRITDANGDEAAIATGGCTLENEIRGFIFLAGDEAYLGRRVDVNFIYSGTSQTQDRSTWSHHPNGFFGVFRNVEDQDYFNTYRLEMEGDVRVSYVGDGRLITEAQIHDVDNSVNFVITTAKTLCYGPNGSSPGTGTYNFLGDGNMEQQPLSSYWRPETSSGGTEFGRLNTNNIFVNLSPAGEAHCGSGVQIIGNYHCDDGIFSCQFANLYLEKNYSGIRQRFSWPGGRMYYYFAAKGLPTNPSHQVQIRIYVKNMTTRQDTVIWQGGLPWNDYAERQGDIGVMPVAIYEYAAIMGNGNAQGDAFLLDDTIIGTTSIDMPNCIPVIAGQTVTPTPPIIGTPTRTPTAYITGNLIDNCGFEDGEAHWFVPSSSLVVYAPLEIANNYAHVNSNASSGITQQFNWPGGLAYVRVQSDSPHNVFFTNVANNATYQAINSTAPTGLWGYHQNAVNLPPGTYRLNLYRPAGWASNYDNISVSGANYTSCEGGSNATATAIPTSTPNNTPTMWPTSTQRPTSTVPVGQATSTPIPSFTPYPTHTPYTPPAPTITPNPFFTPTRQSTYTPQPTYTPYPTYTMPATSTTGPGTATSTPPATYTPDPPTATPPVPPPPPGYYSDCNRPMDGGMAGWLEYEKCQMLSFFSMSPGAVATVQALPTMMAGKEPVGSFDEFSDTAERLKGLIDSYDWENTGLDGVNDPIDTGFLNGPAADSPLAGGDFDLRPDGEGEISHQCDSELAEMIGPGMAQGACFIF